MTAELKATVAASFLTVATNLTPTPVFFQAAELEMAAATGSVSAENRRQSPRQIHP